MFILVVLNWGSFRHSPETILKPRCGLLKAFDGLMLAVRGVPGGQEVQGGHLGSVISDHILGPVNSLGAHTGKKVPEGDLAHKWCLQ